MISIKKSYNNYPKEVTADAGYGSEENYDYLEENKIKGFVKYSLFDKQQKGSNQTKTPFSVDKLFYNKEQDCYICPMGQPMSCLGTFKIQNASGFEQEVKKYQAANCANCPLNGACHKSAGNRIIQVNENLNRHKEIAYELLNSEEGILKRKKTML